MITTSPKTKELIAAAKPSVDPPKIAPGKFAEHFEGIAISGEDIIALMREHDVTEPVLQERYDFSSSEVRTARTYGLLGYKAALFIKAITGAWIV